MKRLIVLSLLATTLISSTVYARPLSESTRKLMQEAGIEYDVPVEEVLRRQEAIKSGKAYKSTLDTEKRQIDTNNAYSTATDEYRITSSGGKQSTRVTDTDDLHIYNNNYGQKRSYGSKQSTDEFHTAPVDIDANDGYGAGGFDELHINENFRQNVWQPDHKINRLTIDEFRLPSDM